MFEQVEKVFLLQLIRSWNRLSSYIYTRDEITFSRFNPIRAVDNRLTSNDS